MSHLWPMTTLSLAARWGLKRANMRLMEREPFTTGARWSDQLERWRCTDEWPSPIFDALLKLIPRMCRTYDPRLYSPLRMWNEDAYRTPGRRHDGHPEGGLRAARPICWALRL